MNVEVFNNQLNEYEYRKDVYQIVSRWDRTKIILFLNNLHPDQLDEPLPNDMEDRSVDELIKITCMVVWGWGWEGSDYFIKMFR